MDEEHTFGKDHAVGSNDTEHINAGGKDIRMDAYKIAYRRRVQFYTANYTTATGKYSPRLGNAVEDHGDRSRHAVICLGYGKGTAAVKNYGKIKVVVLATASETHRIAGTGGWSEAEGTAASIGMVNLDAGGDTVAQKLAIDIDVAPTFIFGLVGYKTGNSIDEVAAFGKEADIYGRIVIDDAVVAGRNLLLHDARTVKSGTVGTVVDGKDAREEVVGMTVEGIAFAEGLHPAGIGADLVVAAEEVWTEADAAAGLAVKVDDKLLTVLNVALGVEKVDIEHTARTDSETVGTHNVGLVPDSVADKVEAVVEMKVDLLLDTVVDGRTVFRTGNISGQEQKYGQCKTVYLMHVLHCIR